MIIRITKRDKVMSGVKAAALNALLVAPLFAIGVPPAQALDTKYYAGSACVKYTGSGIPTYNASAIGNSSTTATLYLDCPAVRENGDLVASYVYVSDRSGNDSVRCSISSVFMLSSGGMAGWFGALNYSGGSSGTRQTLITSGHPAVSLAGHYYVNCRIPPKYNGQTSYVATYEVLENN